MEIKEIGILAEKHGLPVLRSVLLRVHMWQSRTFWNFYDKKNINWQIRAYLDIGWSCAHGFKIRIPPKITFLAPPGE